MGCRTGFWFRVIKIIFITLLVGFLQANLIKTKKTHTNKCMRFYYFEVAMNYFTEAFKNSLFIRAMFSNEIPFGHSISHAPVLVQFPNPSSSI